MASISSPSYFKLALFGVLLLTTASVGMSARMSLPVVWEKKMIMNEINPTRVRCIIDVPDWGDECPFLTKFSFQGGNGGEAQARVRM